MRLHLPPGCVGRRRKPLDGFLPPIFRRGGSQHRLQHGDRACERRTRQSGGRGGQPGPQGPVLAVFRQGRHSEQVIGGQPEGPRDPDQRLEVRFVRLVGIVAVTRLAEAETSRDLRVRQPQFTRALFQSLAKPSHADGFRHGRLNG